MGRKGKNKNKKGGAADMRLPLKIDREGGDDEESESVDDDNGNDTDPADLMGKYDREGKKKGKGGRRRYRDDDEIEDLHGLYEEPKDNDGDRGDHNDDWDDMDEKEW